MVNNKKQKKKKEKKEPEYRTKEERQKEVKHILEQLSEFQLNIDFELFQKLDRAVMKLQLEKTQKILAGTDDITDSKRISKNQFIVDAIKEKLKTLK